MDGYPYGTALLGPELVHSQRYDVTVVLSIPSTPSNRAVGNFMIDLKLLQNLDHSPGYASNASRNYAVRSRRPASLTYASPMVDITRRFSMLPLYVLGLKRETENLKVRILERIEFPRSGKSVPEALRLEIQSETYMHIYKASIRFDARFSGLRWVMYNWRILSFLIFGSAFWLCSMSIAAWVWVILSSWSAGRGKTTIKDEDTDSEGDDRFLTGRPSMLKRRASSSVPRIKREEENTEPVDYGNTEDGEETIDNDSEGSISE
ncbi:hypothetical protein FQN57_000070 [Myotisia sp. PD_48]|nr:hypothetical protein FQN57_000070 [Myotisia sp. PD_48]